MMHATHPNSYPHPNDVIEISRRVKTRQRELFRFLHPLRNEVSMPGVEILAVPNDVRVNLISRFDTIKPKDFKATGKAGSRLISDLIGLRETATCDEYASLTLGEPVLSNKGNGWQAVEMPIIESDYPFGDERVAVAAEIDRVTSRPDGLWTPEEPALQVVEFVAGEKVAEAMLEFVALQAPRQTEVFAAALRFRLAPSPDRTGAAI